MGTRRYFYTDPLAAAWMAQHFGMQFLFNDHTHTIPGDLPLEFDDLISEVHNRFVKQFWVHPDSINLLKPQVDDLIDGIRIGRVQEVNGEEITVDVHGGDWEMDVNRVSAEEFLRRFLLHVLPRGFVRIRHYGLLAGGPAPSAKFDRCRQLLGTTGSKASPPEPTRPDRPAWWEEWQAKFAKSRTCPKCQGELHRVPWDGRPLAGTEPELATVPTAATVCDSS